jgi:hypothetical protein
MPLIKEDGTGLANANSYANVADADAYHENHLWATTWTSASTPNKEKALAMATRLIDGSYQFHGLRLTSTQALQWPRTGVPNPDRGDDFASNALPADLVRACCEMAREVIALDRTKEPNGLGLHQLTVPGTVHFQFDKNDKPKIMTPFVQLLLTKLGKSLETLTTSATILRA